MITNDKDKIDALKQFNTVVTAFDYRRAVKERILETLEPYLHEIEEKQAGHLFLSPEVYDELELLYTLEEEALCSSLGKFAGKNAVPQLSFYTSKGVIEFKRGK